MKPNKVIHIVLNDFSPDYRVLKEVSTLANSGYNTIVFSKWRNGLPRKERSDHLEVIRFKLNTGDMPRRVLFQSLKYIECIVKMVVGILIKRPDVIHCHDLSALPIGWFAKLLLRCVLVYDSHELWSDTNDRGFPRWFMQIAISAERYMCRKTDATITVSDGIAETMQSRLNIEKPTVIRNVPERSLDNADPDLRQLMGIPYNAVVFIYIGGILPNRGVDTLLKAFLEIKDPHAHLVFLGSEGFPDWFNVPVPPRGFSRIHFHKAVAPRKVVPTARGADIGVHSIRGTSLSHQYCLPNKLFEYIQAGLSVLMTDLPEMRNIVDQYKLGRVFPDGDECALSQQMSLLCRDGIAVKKMKFASLRAAKTLCWQVEQKKLLKLYGRLIQ